MAGDAREAASETGTAPRILRNFVVRLFGTPDATEGSLNEPRLRMEHGLVFNEKWTYDWPRDEPSRPRARVIYWQRYDFVASVRVEQDGHAVRESEREIRARAGVSA